MRTILPFTCILFFLFSANAKPSDKPIYTVGSDALIIIAANEAPSEFQLDVKAMHFKSAEVMKTYCETISSFVVNFTPDFNQQKINVVLYNDKIPNGAVWGVKEWNDFFLSYQPKWYTYFTQVNL